jgi:cell division protein FtsW
MVYSASSALALKKFGSDYFFLKKHALFAFAGIIILVISRHFPYRYYRPLAYPLLVLSLALLAIIQFTDLGLSAGGSTRWMRLGSFSFQPSEFARFALVIYLAYSLEKKADRIKSFSIGFLPHALVLGVMMVLIFIQPDFGSVFILGALAWFLLFIGGVRMSQLLAAMIVILPAAYLFLINAEYRAKRILGFLNPWEYSTDEGYQIVHSLMAFGTGGFWGSGIGKGYQKLFYLPEPHTDFIFSVIGEELGLLGVLIIIALYAWIVIRGIAIARSAPDLFAVYLAAGLTIAMGLQIVVNMGVTLGLLPTKGLTLPLLSYGGTSLLLNMASIGILMNISASRTK